MSVLHSDLKKVRGVVNEVRKAERITVKEGGDEKLPTIEVEICRHRHRRKFFMMRVKSVLNVSVWNIV